MRATAEGSRPASRAAWAALRPSSTMPRYSPCFSVGARSRAVLAARRILSCRVGPSGSSMRSSSAQVWYWSLSHLQPSTPAQVVPWLTRWRGSSSFSRWAQSASSSFSRASSSRRARWSPSPAASRASSAPRCSRSALARARTSRASDI